MEIKLSYIVLFSLSLNLRQNFLCLNSLHAYQSSQIKDQLGPINKLLSLKREAYYLATIISLEICCLQNSFLLISLVYCLLDMDYILLLLDFMKGPFTMILRPVLFGLKIRYPQEPVKQSQVRNIFNNGFGSKLVLRYLT